jgi:hypothetical protein
MDEQRTPAFSDRQKELILRALTDPKFRRQLGAEPEEALGIQLDELNRKEIAMVLAAVKGIEAQIAALADQLLCAGGGGCHIAAA